MLCLGCGRLGSGRLCESCRPMLRPGAERVVSPGFVVRSGMVHAGPARSLVHLLKYRGVVEAGRILAEWMAPLVEPDVVLVPVPRVGWRLLKYGIDPAVELAEWLSRFSGRPVVRALIAPMWGRSRAGRQHGSSPRFRPGTGIPDGPVQLIDDVITTGTTLTAASLVLASAVTGLTATAAPGEVAHQVTSLRPGRQQSGVEESAWR